MQLIMGEFAHAMPHQVASAAGDALVTANGQEVPCGDHAGPGKIEPGQSEQGQAAQLSSDSGAPTAKTHDSGAHETNCCETTCNCPCLHLSAMAMPTALLSVAMLDQQLFPAAAPGHMPDRIFLLFRPPA
jgi:hypothetical protein